MASQKLADAAASTVATQAGAAAGKKFNPALVESTGKSMTKEVYHHDDRNSKPSMSTKHIVLIVVIILCLVIAGVLIWQSTISSGDSKTSSGDSSTGCQGSCDSKSKPC